MYRLALVALLAACRSQPAASTPPASNPGDPAPAPTWPVPPPMEGATMDEACYQQCMGTEGVDPNGCWYDCNVRPPGPSSSECYADCMAEIGDDLTCAEDCECDCACSLDCE